MNSRTHQSQFVKMIASVACLATVLAASACSSTGGKPAPPTQAWDPGSANTPRATVAMITHGPPGDTFWDLIRKGAETAAAKDNIDLKYSAGLQGPDQANLVQNAVDSKVDALAVTLANPEALPPALQAAPPPASRRGAQRRHRRLAGRRARRPYFGQDEQISGEAAGKRLAAEGAQKVSASSRTRATSRSNPAAPASKRASGGRVENLNVNGTDMPSVQSTITAKLQQDPSIDYIVTLGRRSPRRGAVRQDRRQQRENRHLRHQRRTRRRHQIGEVAMGGRSATVPAGLPRRGLAVAVPQQPQHHRRRSARTDRTGLHRQIATSTPSPNTPKTAHADTGEPGRCPEPGDC